MSNPWLPFFSAFHIYHPVSGNCSQKAFKCSSHELVIVAVGNITARHIGKDSSGRLPGAKCQTVVFNTEKKGLASDPKRQNLKLSRLMISDHFLMIFGWFLMIFRWFPWWLAVKERSPNFSSSRREMVLEERRQSLKSGSGATKIIRARV